MRKRAMTRKMRHRKRKKTPPVCLRHSDQPAPHSAPIPGQEAAPQLQGQEATPHNFGKDFNPLPPVKTFRPHISGELGKIRELPGKTSQQQGLLGTEASSKWSFQQQELPGTGASSGGSFQQQGLPGKRASRGQKATPELPGQGKRLSHS